MSAGRESNLEELLDELESELRSAVGKLVIEFGRCELAVAELTAVSLGAVAKDARDGINTVLSFRQKLDLIAAVGYQRLDDPVDAENLHACLDKLGKFEQERNTFLHSKYGFKLAPEMHVKLEGYSRSKQRSDRKRGLLRVWEDVDLKALVELSRKISRFIRLHPDNGPLYEMYWVFYRLNEKR